MSSGLEAAALLLSPTRKCCLSRIFAFLTSYSTFSALMLLGMGSTLPLIIFFSTRTINGKLKMSKKRVTAGTRNRFAQNTLPVRKKRNNFGFLSSSDKEQVRFWHTCLMVVYQVLHRNLTRPDGTKIN